MDTIAKILLVGLVIRIVLDLSSMSRPWYVFDAIYMALFLILGLVQIATDPQSVFGYFYIVVAIVFGSLGIYRYKKQHSAPHKES